MSVSPRPSGTLATSDRCGTNRTFGTVAVTTQTLPRNHPEGCSRREPKRAKPTYVANAIYEAGLDLHGEILSVAGSEVLVCQLIAEIDPLFIRDRLPSSDPVVRFLAHGVTELRLIRF